jgi:hypothetical protein
MLTSVEVAFKGLLTCLQSLKMYGPEHPMFKKTLDKAYEGFVNVLAAIKR